MPSHIITYYAPVPRPKPGMGWLRKIGQFLVDATTSPVGDYVTFNEPADLDALVGFTQAVLSEAARTGNRPATRILLGRNAWNKVFPEAQERGATFHGQRFILRLPDDVPVFPRAARFLYQNISVEYCSWIEGVVPVTSATSVGI